MDNPLKQYDALIVGAGPVGLFMANELIRHGLSCRIIDKKNGLNEQSRALALHIRTLLVFNDCGYLPTFMQRGHRVKEMLLKSHRKTLADIKFDHVDAPIKHITILPQSQTEAILLDALQKRGVDVQWQTELVELKQDDDKVTAKIRCQNDDIETIEVPWLMGCDGARSATRHLLQFDFPGAPYKQHWWLADLDIQWQQPAERMMGYLSKSGPMLFFPLGGSRYRMVTTAPEGGPQIPSDQDVKDIIIKRCSDPCQPADPTWLSGFNIQHRHVKQYFEKRIFLAGDAAHIHSPMGGQGLNTGIQDAYNLAWKLALVHKKQANPSLLDSYQAERLEVGKAVVRETDMMTKLVVSKNPITKLVRNCFLSFASSSALFKNKLTTKMAQLAISYKNSPIVQQCGKFNRLHAGDLIPNITLTTPSQSDPQTIYDLLRGTQHHLLLIAGVNQYQIAGLKKITALIESRYANLIQCHLVIAKDQLINGWEGSILFDNNNVARQRLHASEDSLLLVRPDQYIGFIGKAIDVDKLQQLLHKLFLD